MHRRAAERKEIACGGQVPSSRSRRRPTRGGKRYRLELLLAMCSDQSGEDKLTQNCRSILDVITSSNVVEEWSCRNSEHTSKEITRPAVAACSRCRVWAISADHIVNGCHVDSVIGNTNDGRENHGANPVNGRTLAGPSETNQTNW